MSKKLEQWVSDNGVVAYNTKHLGEFEAIAEKIKEVITPLVGRVTFRDLYDIAKDAAVTAVGDLVRTAVLAREETKYAARQKTKKQRKRR